MLSIIPLPYRILALIAAVGLALGGGYWKGRADGRVAQLKDTVKAYEKRKDIDDDVSNLDRFALCVDLGGLLADCEQLRRVDPAAEGQ